MVELYFMRAKRDYERWPCRGGESGTDYSEYHVVVAGSREEADRKLLAKFNHPGGNRWEIDSFGLKKLNEDMDISLEDRLRILHEVVKVIE